MTSDQKRADFEHLAGLFAKAYGPADWKYVAFGWDPFYLKPWLERIDATRSDLEFYDLMVEYVSRFDDAHVGYSVPSNFVARLNFSVDIYDGKPLVDFINRTRLPASEFPFGIAYELVSIDGKSAEELINQYLKYGTAANPRSTRRFAASYVTSRFQQVTPFAAQVGDIATVVFRHPSTGELETYKIPWTKTGLPLIEEGPVPSPKESRLRRNLSIEEQLQEVPEHLRPLRRLQHAKLPVRAFDEDRAILNFGARSPIFAMPENFVQRLGRANADFFFSGVYQAGGYRIGFIRIPAYDPADELTALTQFLSEISFMEANTDGLVIDDMRNPGGFVSVVNTLLSMVIPYRHRTLGFEVRATSAWVADISSALESAKALGEDQEVIDLLTAILDQLVSANAGFRGTTGPIPLDDVTLDRDPFPVSYSKPLMVLVDEMSASGGDAFPATIQDNKRGLIYGWRTMGAGGTVFSYTVGTYSEGSVSLTESLMNRIQPIVTPEYPTAPYVENIGVRPDIVDDYMTLENLRQQGRPFVRRFTAAMVEHISRSRQ